MSSQAFVFTRGRNVLRDQAFSVFVFVFVFFFRTKVQGVRAGGRLL